MKNIFPFRKKKQDTTARAPRGGLTTAVTDYLLVYGDNLTPAELEAEIATKLSEGWQPWGNPIIYRGELMQAMTKHAV